MKPETDIFTELPLMEFRSLQPDVSFPVYDDFNINRRKNLRQRFMAGGSSVMQDAELLELVLYRATQNADVKPLAKRLIRRFGDFNGVISADQGQLMNVPGVDSNVTQELKIVEASAHRLAQSKVLHKDVLSSWEDLLCYCKTAMSHRQTEQFRILFLDRKNVLIADEAQQEGTVDHVPVYPREVAKRALELNASAIILVHNHPSGDPDPSEEDIAMTYKIEMVLDGLGVTIHDHVVIGKELDFSFRSEGLLA